MTIPPAGSTELWIQKATTGLAEPLREMIATEIRAHQTDALADGLNEQQAISHLGSASQAARTYRQLYPRSSEERALCTTCVPDFGYGNTWAGLLAYLPTLMICGLTTMLILFRDFKSAAFLLTPLLLAVLARWLSIRRAAPNLRRAVRERHQWTYVAVTLIVLFAVFTGALLTAAEVPTQLKVPLGFLFGAVLMALIYGGAHEHLDSRGFIARLDRAKRRGLSDRTLQAWSETWLATRRARWEEEQTPAA